MKKSLVSLLVGTLFIPMTSALAETIVYDGSDPGMLQALPLWLGGGGNALFPGSTASPADSGNSITVTGGNIGDVYGGLSENGTATHNTVNINGGTVNVTVIGGQSQNSNATDNTVTLNGASVGGGVSGIVSGGISENGIVTRNTVTLNGGSVGTVFGGHSQNGNATHNTVNLNGSNVSGTVFGGHSQNGNATHNTVNLNGSNVGGIVFGGDSENDATHNTVTLNTGTIGTIYGGHSSVMGNTTSNTVILNGGNVGGDVSGGFSTDGSANYNTVTLNSGRVDGNIYGGNSSMGSGATYNTVNLNGSSVIGVILGGYSASGGDAFTGNTLNVSGRHSVGGLMNFQYLNFTLPGDMTAGDTLITTVLVPGSSTGAVDLGGTSTVGSINMAGGRSALTAGDIVTLISSASPISGSVANTTASGTQGFALRYEWDNIAVSGNTLTARLASASANPQTHALLQGRSAQSAMLTQGADLVAGAGLQSMLINARLGNRSFIAMQGGSSRYETGSGVNMDSFSLMAGASWAKQLNPDTEVALGAFVETGTGSYHSSNSFTNMPSVKGSGNTDYIGVGLIGNLENASGLHADAALRIGRVTTDLNTDVYFGGEKGEYDTSSLYIGAHLGAGYKLALTQADSLDLYGRYSWNHVDSENVTVLGDKYHFDASDSHRLRGGLRYARTIGNLMPYGGIAYEYELDGKAKGSVYGYDLKATDMGGGTVIGELGLSWVPAAKDNLRVDIALEGFAGKRDGVMANARLNYRF